MNPPRIALLAAAATFLLAILIGGVFGYLFLVCFLTAMVLVIRASISGRAPVHDQPVAGQKPAQQPVAPPAPKVAKPKPNPPVFEESLEFAELDPHSASARRTLLAQQVSRKIQNGLYLTKRDIEKADAGDYELDRIGLYVWEGISGRWPQERCVHVEHEFELAKASGNAPSLMALGHALESFQKAVDKGRAGMTQQEIELLASIHDFMKDNPDLDGAGGIQTEVDTLLSAKPSEPAINTQAPPSPIVTAYEKIRDARREELANRREFPLHVASLQVFANINDNGDAVINERYQMVSSEGGPIDSLPTAMPADYSYVPDVLNYVDKTPGQNIEFKFDVPGAHSGKAHVLFDPPIESNPISYSRAWTRFNAVYFNQRDRTDSGFPGSTEDLSFPVRYRYDKLSFRIAFPKRIHPAHFGVQCRPLLENGTGEVDEAESEWAARGIDWNEHEGVVWLDISEPLPVYSYALVWDLPRMDADELALTPWQSSTARELNDRFLSLRESSSSFRSAALAAMGALAAELQTAFGDDLHIRLFVYISKNGKGGLIEVLESSGGAVSAELVTIGRTLAGRSFRRKRSILRYQSVKVEQEDKSFEKIPSEMGLEKPSVAVAMPLLCPENTGRRVGVVYVSTWNRDSKLFEVGLPGAATSLFAASVVRWYANDLCNAVNMKGVLQTMFQQKTVIN